MSNTFTLHPIFGCLVKAQEFINCEEWRPINDAQKRFLQKCMRDGMGDVSKFDGDELKCKAAGDIEEINAWLADNGFPDLQLKPQSNPTAFAVASILHVFLKWIKKGKKATVQHKGNSYPAAKLDYDEIRFFTVDGHPHPIAYVPTQTADEYVMMTIYPGLADVFDWIQKVRKAYIDRTSEMRFVHDFNGLVFPTIEYDEMADISFIKNMENPGDDPSQPPWFIAEAIQQTRFKMNEVGAEVESAAAMSMARKCAFRVDPPMTIDQPFLLAIFRKELAMPYFLAHFTEENWKKVEIDFK